MVLTLTTKETTWLKPILTKVAILDKDGQYIKIRVTKNMVTK